MAVGESSRTSGTLAAIPMEWAGDGEGEKILSGQRRELNILSCELTDLLGRGIRAKTV